MQKRNRWLKVLTFVATCVMCLFLGACELLPMKTKAEKIKDGTSIQMLVGETSEILVEEYVTANGNEVQTNVDNENVTAVLEEGKITITAIQEGESVLTITCGEVEIVFNVTVDVEKFSVTVDGTAVGNYEVGSKYQLPEYTAAMDSNHEFLGWIVNGDNENLKRAGDEITVEANVVITSNVQRKAAVLVKAEGEAELTVGDEETGVITANVAEYMTVYGREVTVESSVEAIATATLQDGVITITAVAKGEANVVISCGDLRATIALTVKVKPVAPTMANGNIQIDLFTQTSGTCTANVLSNPMQMPITYALAQENAKASIDEDGTLTYNADVVENVELVVNCVATYEGEEFEFSFVVTVVVTDTTPAAPTFEGVSLNYDVYTNQEGLALGETLKTEDENFTYVYTVGEETIDANYKFTSTQTVNVAYTYKGNVQKSGATEFVVTVSTVDTTPTAKKEAVVSETGIDIFNKPSIDLKNNVNYLENVKEYKVNGETANIENGIFYVPNDNYGETPTTVTFTVTVINTNDGEFTYTYTIDVINTQAYRVVNGGFEAGMEGWTVSDGMGGVVDYNEYWEGLSYQKEGANFFHGNENKGEGEFVLQSSSFVVGGSGWITFQLGAAAHFEKQYVEVVKVADGSVIANVVNVSFVDAGGFEGDPNKASGLTLMKYKLDLSSVKGEEVYLRVVDTWAEGAIGMMLFDNLVSYYVNADEISTEYTDVTNTYFANVAEKVDLKDSNEVLVIPVATSKGLVGADYTFVGVVQGEATGLTVDGLKLTATKKGEYTVNYTVQVGETEIATFVATVSVSNTTEMPTFEDIAQAYEPSEWDTDTAKEIALYADSERFAYTFTANAGTVEGNTLFYAPTDSGEVVITVTVVLTDKNYTVEDLETATFNVTLTFKKSGIMLPNETPADESYDVFDLEDKEAYTVDFSSAKYITVPESEAEATRYSVTLSVNGGEAQAIDLVNNGYAIALANLTDVATKYTFVVTATCGADELTYTLNISFVDSTAYRLVNGGFESDMEGWTVVGAIGAVSSENNYWLNDYERAEGYAFNKDGDKMFSAYAPGILESAVGTLTSSTFKVGGVGFVTFKIGAMRDGNYVYVNVVDAESKQILARFSNGLWQERTNDVKSGCTLIAYKADLSAFMGKEVYFQIADNADSNYGLFFADSFITYYAEEPADFNVATPVNYVVSGTVYDVMNGGFEMGDLAGWWNAGEPGHVTSADAFFSGVAYGKDGTYLYSGVEDHQAGNGLEGNQGMLTSSAFVVGGSGWISFKYGGGGNVLCYIEIIDAATNEVLAKYHQQAQQDAVLIQYVADLSAYMGRTVRFRFVDKASGGWGCSSLDSVVTYYADVNALPEGITATDIKYQMVNGSFESGLDGWTMNITEAGTHNTLGWVLSEEVNQNWYTKNDDTKDGANLFTFVTVDDVNCENSKGTLSSATFILKQNAFVSFKFGGAGGAQNHDVHIQLCNADGSVIATFYNDKEGKVNTRMNAYYYQYTGNEAECFFRVVDNSTGDYGCFVVDDFRVNLETAPEGYTAACM